MLKGNKFNISVQKYLIPTRDKTRVQFFDTHTFDLFEESEEKHFIGECTSEDAVSTDWWPGSRPSFK